MEAAVRAKYGKKVHKRAVLAAGLFVDVWTWLWERTINAGTLGTLDVGK